MTTVVLKIQNIENFPASLAFCQPVPTIRHLKLRDCSGSRGGRIHKFKDTEPLRIQQKEIQFHSGSSTFSILPSVSAPDPPLNHQTPFTTKRTKPNSKKNISRSSLKIGVFFQVRTKKFKKRSSLKIQAFFLPNFR